MPAAAVDLTLASRWILPMTSPAELLGNHTLVVRDGRILDVLPTELAAVRYIATIHVERSEHLVMPGLVNAYTQISRTAPGHASAPERLRDGALQCIAEMIKSGTTCFCNVGFHPEESARTAAEQGMRTLIGIPIAEVSSTWAKSPDEYLTRALNFRDEYRGHPTIATAFAPHEPAGLGDATFRRIATLADELDSGVLTTLHESRQAVEECLIRHGQRPLERMHALGLLTPAFCAAHIVHATTADIALAQRSGIAVLLCPETNVRWGGSPPPVAAWAASGLRLGLGSGGEPATSFDLWSALRFLTLLSHSQSAPPADGTAPGVPLGDWESLAVVTRGGAAALGLDAEIGTLERGKWADLCCVDLRGPALWRADALHSRSPAAQLLWNGGRDAVSDVWVSGRHLLNDGAFTRLDWPGLTERTKLW